MSVKAKKMKVNQAGFTLLEMMVVIAIVGLIASITPPIMNDILKTRELNHFLVQFQADALYAKNYAQLLQKRVYIRIFPSEREYRIYENSQAPLLVREFPASVCVPNQTALFEHYTPSGAISRGHTIYFGDTRDCRLNAPTTRKLVMTIGNSVYYDAP